MKDFDLRKRLQEIDGLRGLAQRTTMGNFLEEAVEHPEHYRKDSGFEAIEIIEEWGLGFHLGNALKYIARAGLKDPEKAKEDLDKAVWYIKRYQESYLQEITEDEQ